MHIVTPELDDGPVLVQQSAVKPEDTESTLSNVLEQEHLPIPKP